jgi:2-methylisocitrate lyase-like PEP mutase family enzyme
MTTPDAASAFRRLHQGELLLLPNCWDAGSARLTESLGARAIATTSAGVAWAHGYRDGNALPPRLLAATVGEIVRVVRVPVTADMEGGYSDDLAAVETAVALVVEAGAVGINLEDATKPPDLLCRKIEAAKRGAKSAGVDLFVNARADVYLRGLVPPERRVEETLRRAALYRAAGADGFFAPNLSDPEEIRAVASGAGLPLNVIPARGLPPIVELRGLGVARLSAGADIAESMFGFVSGLARGFLATRAYPITDSAMPYAEINALFPT